VYEDDLGMTFMFGLQSVHCKCDARELLHLLYSYQTGRTF